MSVLSGIAALVGRGRRVPRRGVVQLTSKNGPRTFYKGKGCEPTGKHTSKGGYSQLPWKQPEIVIPDLTGFALKPYVTVPVTTAAPK